MTAETLLIICLVPLKNCLREARHQYSIEGVRLGGTATRNPSHEVPHIQPYLPFKSSLWIDQTISLLAGDPILQTALHTWMDH